MTWEVGGEEGSRVRVDPGNLEWKEEAFRKPGNAGRCRLGVEGWEGKVRWAKSESHPQG